MASVLWGMEFIFKWPLKDLVFQHQKGKMPCGWGCTYSNIFGFFILARKSSFIRFFFCFSWILFKSNCSKWNICWCWFYSLELPTIWKPAESKRSVVRIRAQYSLVIVMVPFALETILIFTKLWGTKFVQQNWFLTSYSFKLHIVLLKFEYLKVIFISLLDFYHHIRAATLQNSKLN